MNSKIKNSKINNLIRRPGLVILAVAVVMSLAGGSAVAGKLLTGKNVANNSLTGIDVKNSSLTGTDVKNGTIDVADLSGAALAGVKGDKGDKGDPGTHGSIGTATSVSTNSTSSTTFIDVPGMTVSFAVPATATKLLMTYSAECSIIDPADDSYVSTRILVDGVEASPVAGTGFAFCNTGAPTTVHEFNGSSMQRTIAVTPGVTHEVKVQYRSSDADATARLDDDILSIITAL